MRHTYFTLIPIDRTQPHVPSNCRMTHYIETNWWSVYIPNSVSTWYRPYAFQKFSSFPTIDISHVDNCMCSIQTDSYTVKLTILKWIHFTPKKFNIFIETFICYTFTILLGISREHVAAEDHQGMYMYIYSCNCNRSNIVDNSSCHSKDAAYFENYSWHLMDFKLSKADLFDCKIDLIKTSENITVSFDKHGE